MIAAKFRDFLLGTLLLSLVSLSACKGGSLVPVGPALPTVTPNLPPTPTETSVPLALSVNGEGVTQAEFDAELARYQAAQAALGKTVSPADAAQAVRTDLIDTLLLAQGAAGYQFNVDDATLQARIDSLSSRIGGATALSAWESAHGYTDQGFRQALRWQIAAAWMRDQILSSVPTSAEQVHVKQILLYNAGDAQSILNQLQAGTDFNTLAAQYDPTAHGDLGWFPRGYLTEPAVEQAAFALQPGQISPIVQTPVGFSILMLVEHDPNRPLSPDALLTLQQHAVQDWLKQRLQESTISPAP
jgi:peptidyl-prolyl cis-trans isomerase C